MSEPVAVTAGRIVIDLCEFKRQAFGRDSFQGRGVGDLTVADLREMLSRTTSSREARKLSTVITAVSGRVEQWALLLASQGMNVPADRDAFERQQLDEARDDIELAAYRVSEVINALPRDVEDLSYLQLLSDRDVLVANLRTFWDVAFDGTTPTNDGDLPDRLDSALEALAPALVMRQLQIKFSMQYRANDELTKADLRRISDGYLQSVVDVHATFTPAASLLNYSAEAYDRLVPLYDLALDRVAAKTQRAIYQLRRQIDPFRVPKPILDRVRADVAAMARPGGLATVIGMTASEFSEARTNASKLARALGDYRQVVALNEAIAVRESASRSFAEQVRDKPSVAPFVAILGSHPDPEAQTAALVAIEYIAHQHATKGLETVDALDSSLPQLTPTPSREVSF